MYSKEELDFAYRYPFSDEAKAVIKSLDMKRVEQSHLIIGKVRLEEALQNERLEYKETNYGKLDYVIGYVYARMLLSALRNRLYVTRYSTAEARRAGAAMEHDTDEDVLRLAGQLGVPAKRSGSDFTISFANLLNNMPNDEAFSLANQRLASGEVTLDRHQIIKVLEVAVKRSVEAGLPLKHDALPKQVIDYAKEVRRPVIDLGYKPTGGKVRSWIERLLATPIHDCRHRTVNLILAPYLVNVKGMDVDKATEVIVNYIALCKTVNPQTNITDRYIRYQCEYAKNKGMKPLSLRRARDELGGIDFTMILGEGYDDEDDMPPQARRVKA